MAVLLTEQGPPSLYGSHYVRMDVASLYDNRAAQALSRQAFRTTQDVQLGLIV